MSQDEVVIDMTSAKVRERPQVINVPVRILGDQTRPATVAYALTSSTATLGKDFTVTGGTLTFGPGETVKTFPVRILARPRTRASRDDHAAARRRLVRRPARQPVDGDG